MDVERFTGFVDEIRDGRALVTLTDKHGKQRLFDYSADELLAAGIKERRGFVLEFSDRETFTPIEEGPMSDDEIAKLNAELKELCTPELDGDY